jgi:deaminated glutathione amidase
MRVGLVQLCSSDDPAENAVEAAGRVREAASGGAALVLTPEVTNCVSGSRSRQRAVLRHEEDDPTLATLREAASASGVWLLIGSLALLTHDPDGRFANRSFLIAPDGGIAARYDKIHMFDVDLAGGESYRESSGFRPGARAVTAAAAGARIGMTVCYDLRFPHLYRDLAKAGAEILTVPAAFTVPTGRAHWEVLLRARAVETGCFVLAPAQVGAHRVRQGPERRTWGHSLAVSPWGEVLADAGEAPSVAFAELDLTEIGKARTRIPALLHDRAYACPAPG